MAEVDVSLLDVPRWAPVDDAEAYLRAAIAWHFDADTGCPFWLRTARTFAFDPLTDVNTFADLRLFPNLVNELRSVPAEELIPRGYGSATRAPQIFESGGTTGAPKRTVQMPDWITQVIQWQTEDFATGGFVPGRGFLCLMPRGPHGVGYFSRLVSERLGATFYAVDIDPRWVKKLAARRAAAEMAAYVDHVVAQAAFVLRTQNVANVHTTPPLLEAIARNDDVVQLVNDKVLPCVWVSPWSRDAGVGPLRHSLVVTAITGNQALVDDLLAEPTISNVYCGRHPTYHAAPQIPHDGPGRRADAQQGLHPGLSRRHRRAAWVRRSGDQLPKPPPPGPPPAPR